MSADATNPKSAGPPATPLAKNPGFVTGTIDGREVAVRPGTSVIEAAQSIGIEIPYFCYHQRLSVVANCRMCLVEMSNAPGDKLVPACQVPITEGVAVRTSTPHVKDQQQATMEFLLLHHPVDCAICDQSGECKLQDYYMEYDRQPSRLDIPKLLKGKRLPLGPMVVLDQERCILCTRCVRFMSEVAKAPQLGVAGRGTESVITTFPGQPLDNPYSGNVVDLCPVGALTSTDFRFRGRVWFMSAARSLCTGCARGCNVFLDYLNDVTYRYRPRRNDRVNQDWMCDRGRLSYKFLNQERVLKARRGRALASEKARESPRTEVVTSAAADLKLQADAAALAVLLSPMASLEDLLAAALVITEGLGLRTAYVGGQPDGWQDDFLKRADENPNRQGLAVVVQAFGLTLRPFSELIQAIEAGLVKGVWAIGSEIPNSAAASSFARLDLFVCQSVSANTLSAAATHLLPASPHSESDGTFVNFEGRAQRFELAYWPRGDSRPHWSLAAEIGQALGLYCHWQSAREVFLTLSPRLGAVLGDFHWDRLPPMARRPGLVPLAAGTVDGRLPGYRERVPNNEDDLRAFVKAKV